MLVDERDHRTSPARALLPGARDPGREPAALRRAADCSSERMLYVELDSTGQARHLHYAPYLDYRPLRVDEPKVDDLLARPECAWITRELEQTALTHAIGTLVPDHLTEVRGRRLDWVGKTKAAVKDRLTKEIAYWDRTVPRS